MGNFKELIVWQKSVSFVTEIYKMTERFRKNKIFGLISQLRRAAVSVPSNISEGHSRRSSLDYLQFLKISRGSLAEVETQLLISKNLGYISVEIYENFDEKITRISKMLNALITSISKPNPQTQNPNS